MVDDSLDWITNTLLGAHASVVNAPAPALFLLRRYAEFGHDDVRAAVEDALTYGINAVSAERDPRTRCQWLMVLAEAAAISDDERLAETVQVSLSASIEDLEQLVRASYEPGEGLLGASIADQLTGALSLVTAFELTGRLPYAMLAEELVQFSRRAGWDEARGTVADDFVTNCRAAQVMVRLAALRRDPEYTSAAVDLDQSYASDAERLLTSLAAMFRDHPADAAEYGVALLDWFALRELPN